MLKTRTASKCPPPDLGTAGLNYRRLAKRIKALAADGWCCEQAGIVSGYQFFAVRKQMAVDFLTILLTGGVHGDEPSGVEAAMQWMEGDAWRHWQLNWLVMPCINPFGWAHAQRTDADGLDINHCFRDSAPCPEAVLVKRVLGRQRFLLALDLHEDSDSDGYYICEIKAGPPFAGERIVREIDSSVPRSRSRRLDGRRAQGPAWVLRQGRRKALERRRQWPLGFHLAAYCTDHFLCSEAPTQPSLSLRVCRHLAVLEAALRFVTGMPEQATPVETPPSL